LYTLAETLSIVLKILNSHMMIDKIKNESLWEGGLFGGGEQNHIQEIITIGKKKIESLENKIKRTKDIAEKEKLKVDIKKIQLDMEEEIQSIIRNLY